MIGRVREHCPRIMSAVQALRLHGAVVQALIPSLRGAAVQALIPSLRGAAVQKRFLHGLRIFPKLVKIGEKI